VRRFAGFSNQYPWRGRRPRWNVHLRPGLRSGCVRVDGPRSRAGPADVAGGSDGFRYGWVEECLHSFARTGWWPAAPLALNPTSATGSAPGAAPCSVCGRHQPCKSRSQDRPICPCTHARPVRALPCSQPSASAGRVADGAGLRRLLPADPPQPHDLSPMPAPALAHRRRRRAAGLPPAPDTRTATGAGAHDGSVARSSRAAASGASSPVACTTCSLTIMGALPRCYAGRALAGVTTRTCCWVGCAAATERGCSPTLPGG